MNLTETIKEKIESKGFRQSFIAKQLNLTRATFWYKMQNNTFKMDEIFKLAKILDINLNKFKEA